jgi:hypothetical protein
MWSAMPFVQADETDWDCVRWQYHWSMWALVDMCGPMLVWSIGFKALGYPPTWIDLVEESQLVEDAVTQHLVEKHYGTSVKPVTSR